MTISGTLEVLHQRATPPAVPAVRYGGQPRGRPGQARDEALRAQCPARGRSLAMQLQDIMTPGVEVIAPEASVYEAADKMRHLDIGPLPVCEGERLIGMLTDRDITVRAVAAGRDPRMTHSRAVMTPDVVYGFEDQDIADAARLVE